MCVCVCLYSIMYLFTLRETLLFKNTSAPYISLLLFDLVFTFWVCLLKMQENIKKGVKKITCKQEFQRAIKCTKKAAHSTHGYVRTIT